MARTSSFVRPCLRATLATAALLVSANPGMCQDSLPAPLKSLGQPARFKPYVGAFFGANSLSSGFEPGGFGLAGVYHDLLPPLVGVGVAAEGYAGSLGSGFDGGARAVLAVPVFFFQAGVDYAFGAGDLDFILSLVMPVRRGGIIGHGSSLRIDWLPGRGQTLNIGITVPVFQGPMGRTRPRRWQAPIPVGSPPTPIATGAKPARDSALHEMAAARDWILQTFALYNREVGKSQLEALQAQRQLIATFRDSLATPDAAHPDGRTYVNRLADWHFQMDVAFGAALDAVSAERARAGAPVAVLARDALLNQVLIPYNAFFGQHNVPDELYGFADSARAAFRRSLPASLPGAAIAAVVETFDGIVVLLEEWRARRKVLVGGDGRLVWIPLQAALLPDQYDAQDELNSFIERLVGRPFRGGNEVAFALGTEFQEILERQIDSARIYHVLWVHDYAGLDISGNADSVAFRQTMAYVRALTNRVRHYDQTGELTRYFVFLDQFYYDTRKSSIWMNVLERPLEPVRLPAGAEGMGAALKVMQDSLRMAVAGSERLQAAVRARGRGWLERVVKVNVSITQPADLSFRSSHLVLNAPFVPDNIARDHRKLAFMDVLPSDPSSGTVVVGGVGVSEAYDDATWDDRALAVRGPAVVAFAQEAARLLRRNGFTEAELPAPFRDLPDSLPGTALDPTGSAMLLASNDVGFGHKGASVAQMVLMTLLPPGSVIYLPDSIWLEQLYMSELVVAALRGCHVLLVTPARSNSPAAGPTLARTWDLFSRLLEIQNGLKPTLDSLGGRLRIGLYQRNAPLTDRAGFRQEVVDGLLREPFLLEELSLTPQAVRETAARLAGLPVQQGRLIADTLARLPRLHAKTQFFASGDLWRALTSGHLLNNLVASEVRLTIGYGYELDRTGMPVGAMAVVDSAAAVFARLPDSTRARAALYFTVGSMNKDARSMLLDGEVNMILAGPKALIGVLEFIYIFGASRWPTTQEQLDELLPPATETDRKRANLIRKAL